eukprot:3421568-Amphidinium_carterae.1
MHTHFTYMWCSACQRSAFSVPDSPGAVLNNFDLWGAFCICQQDYFVGLSPPSVGSICSCQVETQHGKIGMTYLQLEWLQ